MEISSIPDSPLKVRLRETSRRILRLFGGRSSRDVEYDFAYRNIVGKQMRSVDIGRCDSLLDLAFARAGHSVTAYDFRPYPERHPNLTIIQGDFLENQLPPCSFDAVVMVSTIEHIGLGGYGAPERPDADFEVMRELRRILADGGRAILTFPFNERESYSQVREMVHGRTVAKII
jgi:SAM-dependent methyltransferase